MSLLLAAELSGQRVLAIGGGRVAERRLLRLLALVPEVRVVIVAPRLTPTLHRTATVHGWDWRARAVAEDDLDERWSLVLVNVDDVELDRTLCATARARMLWVASANGFGNVRLVAVRAIGPLRLAVDTGGRSPSLARALADRLGEMVVRWLDPVRLQRYESSGWPREADAVEQELNEWPT